MITALLITFLSGAFALSVILPKTTRMSGLLFFVLAWASGLVICSAVSFWSLILIGEFTPTIIIILNLGLLLTLWLVAIYRFSQGQLFIPDLKYPSLLETVSFGLLIIISGAVYYLICASHPFGEWDAWAIWNLKTKFILYGKANWTWIFDRLSWHTHRDYPLALPLMNSWLAVMNGKNLFPAPQILAWLLSILTGTALYAGLRSLASYRAAICATAILLTQPYYSFLATSQYADIVLAFFLLCAVILTQLTLRIPSWRLCLLTGFFIGELTFIKNEGLVMGLLLATLLSVGLIISRQHKIYILLIALSIGILITGSQTLYLKFHLARANSSITNNLSTTPTNKNALNNRFTALHKGMLKEYLNKQWTYVWIFLTGLIITGYKRWFQKENLLSGLFLLLYFFIVSGVYLFALPEVSLEWWIKWSLNRICMTLLPVALFYGFYLHWGHRPDSGEPVEN